MFTYQCKCCGAALNINSNSRIYKCTYCDVMQTVPLLDYDEKAVLWERADNLRRSGEYDRAADVYDQLILIDNQEPDAYWSKMLCRYGVEYVEENGTYKRVPTINRIQYKPVIDDEDYRMTIKLAAEEQHRIYVVQAMQLEALRKEILSVSMTAQPYDIFICYKENDASGRRTDDSVLAGQLYRALTAEGWRVFFSRISLEDKAGTEYEPYIFAALNSAKLMLAVGTSPENFNAVWVKNEWNRYLNRIAERNEGSLVILYKNMLAQHLPEEFAHLQSFDMGAPDFMEELIRGARKLLSGHQQDTPSSVEDTDITVGATAASLLRRAELCLEDGEFDRADEFCELALNCEPENAQVYFTKLLAENKIKNEDELADALADFTQSGSYKKAMRFGDEEFCERLSEISRRCLYNIYSAELCNAANETQYEGVAQRFESLGDYLDSSAKAEECRKQAQHIIETKETAKNERIYSAAKSVFNEQCANIEILSRAEQQFRELGGYMDSALLAERCVEKIKELTAQREKELAEIARIEQRHKKINKLVKMSVLIGTSAVAVIVGVCILINQISLSKRYNNAAALCESGNYDDAITQFTELSGYKDSSDRVTLTQYQKAVSLYENGQNIEAIALFKSLGDYKDSTDMILKARYSAAEAELSNGNYDKAAVEFTSLGDYSDSVQRVKELRYKQAEAYKNSGNFNAAANTFESISGYSDSREQALVCRYTYAQQSFDNKEYDAAVKAFERLEGYSDSAERAILTKYTAADYYAQNGKYKRACDLYKELGDYSDSKEKLLETQYKYAQNLSDSGDYEKALDIYRTLSINKYSDSAQKAEETEYYYALQLADNGDLSRAVTLLSYSDYEKAPESLNGVRYRYAVSLYESGSYNEAADEFKKLDNYSDAPQKAKQAKNMSFKTAQCGDVVYLGEYDQDGQIYNGYEPVGWIVVGREDDRLLVVSKYCLEMSQFGGENWADSYVRRWLNGEFISSAFSAEDLSRILTVNTAERNGASTLDRVFLLSVDECRKYLDDKDMLLAKRTDNLRNLYINEYCKPYNQPKPNSAAGADWWLRSAGSLLGVQYVNKDGIINEYGYDTDNKFISIRPAMWLDISE